MPSFPDCIHLNYFYSPAQKCILYCCQTFTATCSRKKLCPSFAFIYKVRFLKLHNKLVYLTGFVDNKLNLTSKICIISRRVFWHHMTGLIFTFVLCLVFLSCGCPVRVLQMFWKPLHYSRGRTARIITYVVHGRQQLCNCVSYHANENTKLHSWPLKLLDLQKLHYLFSAFCH